MAWYEYYKNAEGKPCFPGIYFSSLNEPIVILKETDTLVLFKKKGATVYIPRRMVYSGPELYLIRKVSTYNDGYNNWQQTELIKSQDYTRGTAKTVLSEMLALMDKCEKEKS